jgi:hypothetical protein
MQIDGFEKDTIRQYGDKDYMFENLHNTEKNLYSINFNEIKREFWEACNDFDKIIPLKHIFQIKFDKLLNSRVCHMDDMGEYFEYYLEEKDLFIERHLIHGMNLSDEEKYEIERIYTSIMLDLSALKTKILELLDEWHQMGIKANEQSITSVNPSRFKLAHKKKTDFIKLISAMYDNQMFETESGFLASSKQELMNEFGAVVNEDLSNYSVLLSKSKNPEKDVFLKPFKDIQKKAEEYYDKES